MYKMLCGLTFTVVSDEEAIEDTILIMNMINRIANNKADPRKDAKNVLKNDFITIYNLYKRFNILNVYFASKIRFFLNLHKTNVNMIGHSFILLGSNLGERESLLKKAISMIGESCGEVVACSKIYETEPWGFVAENNFLNQVVMIKTELNPHDLLKELLSIEAILGRQRDENKKGYASRPMDLDILYYDDLVINDEDLVVPHPRLHLRRFTLLPLCDISSDFEHPIFNKTNKTLLEECEDASDVMIYQNK